MSFLKNISVRFDFSIYVIKEFASHQSLLFQEHIRVLLDVAAEQPDSEYLLQKHFTALLSSVWKARIRGNRGFDTSLSRNGLYSGGRYFPTGNHITRYLGRETTGKLKFGNTSHNCKLIAAALNDAGCTRTDDKKSLSGGRASVATEQLELTLEFEGENDINVSFPSSINLTVSDAVDLSPINLDAGESSGARRLTEVAEIRFRYSSFSLSVTTIILSYDVCVLIPPLGVVLQ